MEEIAVLARHPRVAAALAYIDAQDAATIADMIALTAIAAPSGSESARGEWLTRQFRAAGLSVAAPDAVGNVVAVRAGDDALHDQDTGRGDSSTADTASLRGTIMLASHLDTVFAAGTDLTLRHDGDRICAPGISDNGRGVAAIIRVAHALHAAGITTRRTIEFVGTVGEEGAGDLRGVKHLFSGDAEGNAARVGFGGGERAGNDDRGSDGEQASAARCATFVAVDGAGVQRIVHRAVGSRRLRITVRGPGGHSWNDRGTAHPVHALAAAIAAAASAADFPHSSFSIGRIDGGTGINVIPVEAFADIDIRSEDSAEIARIEAHLRKAITNALDTANAERKTGTAELTYSIVSIGDRPGGATPADADVVRHAWDATRFYDIMPELTSSSTDANVAMSLGIPSIAIGAGGDAGGMHTTDEWYSNEGGAIGIKRLLLLVLMLAEVVLD